MFGRNPPRDRQQGKNREEQPEQESLPAADMYLADTGNIQMDALEFVQPTRDGVEHHLASGEAFRASRQQPLYLGWLEVHQQPFRHQKNAARRIHCIHPAEVERRTRDVFVSVRIGQPACSDSDRFRQIDAKPA